MDRQERDPYFLFLCFLSSLDLFSTFLEWHKITCVLKLFILFPSVSLSPSHSNSVVSLKAFHLDPGPFRLIFSVHSFSRVKGKPALLYLSHIILFCQGIDFGSSFLLDDNSFSFFIHSFSHIMYWSTSQVPDPRLEAS